LLFVKSVCDARQQQLNDGITDSDLLLPGDVGYPVAPGQKLYSLLFDVVFTNNIALSYFIEFMHGIGSDRYVYFYLAVEGYRVSAEQQISAAYLATGSDDLDRIDLEMLREAALTLHNQYLSEKASPRLQVDDTIVRSIAQRLERGDIAESLFDEAQAKVWDMLREDARYFEAFKKSKLYIKLLAELDLLQDAATAAAKPPDEPAIFENGLSVVMHDAM
jgi:sorting nexin-13